MESLVDLVIVAPRVGSCERIPPGSELGDCRSCGAVVWLDPIVLQPTGSRNCPILCFDCLQQTFGCLGRLIDPEPALESFRRKSDTIYELNIIFHICSIRHHLRWASARRAVGDLISGDRAAITVFLEAAGVGTAVDDCPD